MKTKLYSVQTPVTEARGWQLYEIEASSPEEAIRLVKEGGGTFIEEEIEVVDVGEPEILEEEEYDN